jgi:MFS family permease
VFVCAFFADWLKGPYVYALYEAYGFSPNQIAMLFLVGFGVSGISGPFIGAAADIFGRRKLCVAYFATYILSALCKPINSYAMLMIGRLLGGLGTSLLYTVFESWMVAEHNRRGYPNSLLDDTFAKSTLYNGLSAVAAGLIAQAGDDVADLAGRQRGPLSGERRW